MGGWHVGYTGLWHAWFYRVVACLFGTVHIGILFIDLPYVKQQWNFYIMGMYFGGGQPPHPHCPYLGMCLFYFPWVIADMCVCLFGYMLSFWHGGIKTTKLDFCIDLCRYIPSAVCSFSKLGSLHNLWIKSVQKSHVSFDRK